MIGCGIWASFLTVTCEKIKIEDKLWSGISVGLKICFLRVVLAYKYIHMYIYHKENTVVKLGELKLPLPCNYRHRLLRHLMATHLREWLAGSGLGFQGGRFSALQPVQ